ncbi:MAG: hypothetical protein AB7V45_04780 [Candidatus Krumholzibacteriia bacterium]
MKSLLAIIALLTLAAPALAGPIYDMEVGGLYAEGDYVTVVCATVTAVTAYGCAIAESPFQMGNSTWVYLGAGHTAQVGDIVTVYAPYFEYYELTELDVGHYTTAVPAATFTKVGVCTIMPDPIPLTAAAIMAAPEHYESCIVWLTDGFLVTDILTYGEWLADSHETGTQIYFDDYWFDETGLMVGDCANWALGMWTYNFGAFKLEPFVDGFPPVDCTVDAERSSLGGIKALFR